MFVGNWVTNRQPLRRIICPTDQDKTLGLFAQLVGADTFTDSRFRRLALENILVKAQCLTETRGPYTESVRLAVIEGFIKRVFPRTFPTNSNFYQGDYVPDTLGAIEAAARLGIYVPIADLEDRAERLKLANNILAHEITYYIWACPHCPARHDNAEHRWNHILEVHGYMLQRDLW